MNDQTKVQVDMMRKTEQMLYSRSEELFATMVKMPFKGNCLGPQIVAGRLSRGSFVRGTRDVSALEKDQGNRLPIAEMSLGTLLIGAP